MEQGWGHGDSNKDSITIYGGSHTVESEEICMTENRHHLSLSRANCYPTYCRIKINEVPDDVRPDCNGYLQRTGFLTKPNVFSRCIFLALFLAPFWHPMHRDNLEIRFSKEFYWMQRFPSANHCNKFYYVDEKWYDNHVVLVKAAFEDGMSFRMVHLTQTGEPVRCDPFLNTSVIPRFNRFESSVSRALDEMREVLMAMFLLASILVVSLLGLILFPLICLVLVFFVVLYELKRFIFDEQFQNPVLVNSVLDVIRKEGADMFEYVSLNGFDVLTGAISNEFASLQGAFFDVSDMFKGFFSVNLDVYFGVFSYHWDGIKGNFLPLITTVVFKTNSTFWEEDIKIWFDNVSNFDFGGHSRGFWYFFIIPNIFSLLHKLPGLPFFAEYCFVGCHIMILITLYGHIFGIIIYALHTAYILQPQLGIIIFAIHCTWLTQILFCVIFICIIAIIFTLKMFIYFLIPKEAICEISSFTDCMIWMDWVILNLDRTVCVYLALLSYTLWKDAIRHNEPIKLYSRMMHFLKHRSSYIFNKWLVYTTDGEIRWLSSVQSVHKKRRTGLSKCIPSRLQQRYHGHEQVLALLCSCPIVSRKTVNTSCELAWPSSGLHRTIANIRGVLVPMGHPFSADRDIEWRISFCIQELLLADDIPDWAKQGFRAFKHTVKATFKRQRTTKDSTSGCGMVGNYHLKTIFYAYLRKPNTWVNKCPYRLFISLLRKLKYHLRLENLPHFFNSECNIFYTISRKELDISLRCVNSILSDPVLAILKSPLHIHEVYGGSRWTWGPNTNQDRLIALHHRIKSKTFSDEDVFSQIIESLDLHRRWKYDKQISSDRQLGVSRRGEMRSLKDTLFDQYN